MTTIKKDTWVAKTVKPDGGPFGIGENGQKEITVLAGGLTDAVDLVSMELFGEKPKYYDYNNGRVRIWRCERPTTYDEWEKAEETGLIGIVDMMINNKP